MRLPLRLKTILLASAGIVVSFAVSLKVLEWMSPRAPVNQPALAGLPPLAPASRSSTILAPVVISLNAIRDAADRAAPRNFAGKADNPVSQILQNADIGWAASRGPISATGAQDVLALATPLTGVLKITGSLTSKATGAVGDALGAVLGDKAAKQIGSINIKQLDANAGIKGTVTITSRPKLAAAWHFEPKPAAQVNLGDTRSIPLQGTGASSTLPPLWLEVKPIRAIAIQPRVDAQAITPTVGGEGGTR